MNRLQQKNQKDGHAADFEKLNELFADHLNLLDFGHPFRRKRDVRHQRRSLFVVPAGGPPRLLRCWQETELFSLNAVDRQITNGNPPLSVRFVPH